MIKRSPSIGSRRRSRAWRLFFCLTPLPLLAALAMAGSAAGGQGAPGARILQRQVRVSRSAPRRYRVIDVLWVRLDREIPPGFTLPAPLPLVDAPKAAVGVLGMGGDVSSDQVVYDPPAISIVGRLDSPLFEVAFTYTLPGDIERTSFSAPIPVDTLILEVDRATVSARPGSPFFPIVEGGSESRPLARYEADSLAAGQAVALRFDSSEVSWQQRVAVLIATSLAAAGAGIAAWRRRAPSPLAA